MAPLRRYPPKKGVISIPSAAVRRGIFYETGPLLIALIVLGALFAAILIQSTRLNNGIFTYALDDAYIHLTIGKQLALHGVWGIRPDQFTPSSSSLLWTVLLAAGWRISNGSVFVPLIYNCLAALGLLYISNRVFLYHGIGPVVRLILLVVLVIVAPLPSLLFSGMEHIIQIALVVWFCHSGCIYALDRPAAPRPYLLMLLALLNTSIRFEGLFVITVMAGLFVLNRRVRIALVIMLGGLLPIGIAGLISLHNGWYFLPASIMAKTNLRHGGLAALLPDLKNIYQAYRVAPLFLLITLSNIGLFVALRRLNVRPLRSLSTVFQLVAIGITLIHIGYANVGWFHRYEAYLRVLNLIAFVIGVWDIRTQGSWRLNRFLQLGGIGIIGVMVWRSMVFIPDVPLAMHEIYRQQYQMARFVNTAYPNVPVVLNDIGAVSFFTDNRILDLAGLASLEPLQLRREGRFSKDTIAELVDQQQIQLGMIYESWFLNKIPPNWIKIGSWTIPDRTVVLGSRTVSFYVFDPGDVALAHSRFNAFRVNLPATVVVQEAP